MNQRSWLKLFESGHVRPSSCSSISPSLSFSITPFFFSSAPSITSQASNLDSSRWANVLVQAQMLCRGTALVSWTSPFSDSNYARNVSLLVGARLRLGHTEMFFFFFFNFILYLLDLFVLAGHKGLRHLWYTQDMGFKWFAELFAIIFPLKLRWLLFKDASPVERITLKCDIEDTLHFTRCRWHSKKHYFKNGYKALIIISFVFRAA